MAPAARIAATVATAVCETVMTSSPGPMPSALSAKINASVPLATPTRMTAAAIFGECALKSFDFGAENVGPAIEHAINRSSGSALDARDIAPAEKPKE